MDDLTTILLVLSGASAVSVILGIPFIYLQMRQNARLVEIANRQTELVARQNQAQVLLHIAEQMTDREFVLQRKTVRDLVAQRVRTGWDGFVESADGFEVRAFVIRYESAAMMAQFGLVEERTLIETLGTLAVIDWYALKPALDAFEASWGHRTFPAFRELARRSEEYWSLRGEKLAPPAGPAGQT